MPITLTDAGLALDGQTIPVYSGAVHYWRLERERWPLILDQVRELGFRMVETYIPWSVHETAPGQYDWGQADPRKDVAAFMRLCEERGIWLIVRPGPLINAELTDFGFPEWVLLDPAVQARTAVDSLHLDAAWGLHPPRPFPVPSYASEQFYRYAAGWYDAVCPIIAPHLAPQGCVVAVQSDNETCYLFHDQTYATDYSADSLALYQRFLAARYGDIAALNEVYGTANDDFAQVAPPRDCQVQGRADMAWHTDWVAYKEHQIIYAVVRCAELLRERGMGQVPIFHDVAYQYRTPLDIARMEAEPSIDWVGMNLYRNKEGWRGGVQRMRYLAGTTRLPFVPELGCGIWSHYPLTPEPDEQEFVTLGALMHGMKAFNLYMLVERERWQGCPITRHGGLRPEYADFYRRLTAFLDRYQFWRFSRRPPVLALLSYDLGRYAAAAQTLCYAHTDLYGLPAALFSQPLDLGLRWDVAHEADERDGANWFGGLIGALERRAHDYDLSDSHVGAAQLRRYPLVCLQAVDFMDPDDQRRLLDYAEAGGTLLVGPGLPYLDPALRPHQLLGHYLDAPGVARVGAGRLIWAERAGLGGWLDKLLPAASYRCEHPSARLTLHSDGAQTLLFVANPTAAPLDTALRFTGAQTLRAAWGQPETLSGDGALELRLPAYSVQIWEVQHD